jgi:cytochrome c556
MAGGLSFTNTEGNHPVCPFDRTHQSEDRMKKTLGIAVALAGVCVASVALVGLGPTTVALGAGEPNPIIVLRQRLMDADGQAAALAVAMIRGQTPYDPALAATAATIISHVYSNMADLFPNGTDQGTGIDGKPTKAGPDIWKDMAGFKALNAKMSSDAKAAADAAAKGKDAFAQAFQAVGQNCQSCHEKYRQG